MLKKTAAWHPLEWRWVADVCVVANPAGDDVDLNVDQ